MHKDQFTATGPANTGSGHSRTAFSNNPQSNKADQDFTYGVNVQGSRCGVFGESVLTSSERESMVAGVGVYGFGESFGVMGNGARGIAGLCGLHNRGGAGTLGAAMRDGTGVVGLSLGALGNPLETFPAILESSDRRNTGVMGIGGLAGVRGSSDRGTGVAGESSDGNGVRGQSQTNDGVVGSSDIDGRSGVFGYNTSPTGAAFGVSGTSNSESGAGVFGFAGKKNEETLGGGGIGVVGHSEENDGVVGGSDSVGRSGVFGFNMSDSGNAFGVSGQTRSSDGAGVFGFAATDGKGVLGYSPSNDGMVGLSEANGKSGMFGFNSRRSGSAFGVFGRCNSIDGAGVAADNARGHGIKGRSDGSGMSGVFGENPAKPSKLSGPGVESVPAGVTGKADQGIGVVGRSAASVGIRGLGGTYGGVLEGALAPLRLVPSVSGGAPTSGLHQAGELFVDSEGGLFFCVTTGTPGAWKRVQLVDP